MSKIIRNYPIRLSKNKYNIPIYSLHKCTILCSYIISCIYNTNIEENTIILEINKNYINNKCEKHNKIENTKINISDYLMGIKNNKEGDTKQVIDINKIVIRDNKFKIYIEFPLLKKIKIKINSVNGNGFRLKDLLETICLLYKHIYEKEEETCDYNIFNIIDNCNICINIIDLTKEIDKTQKIKNNEVCSICLNNIDMNELIYKFECKHEYHIKCINKWIKTNNNKCNHCPICRNILLNCKKCNNTKIIEKRIKSKIIPKEYRNKYPLGMFRNKTNGIFGIHSAYIENLNINKMEYDNINKVLNLNIVHIC
jgi:hypothetical protein